MKQFCISGILLLFASTSFAQSNGSTWGSLIGNGAGLVEQNVTYTYIALPRAINSCLHLPGVCTITVKDAQLLTRIRNLAEATPAATQGRIQFVAESKQPGFFETGLGQAHRLAKTGTTAQDPIYWNTDQMYQSDGHPAVDVPALIAIWIHELGHQVGELDHQYLDRLGASVRTVLINQLFELKYQSDYGQIKVVALNYLGATAKADLYVSDDVTVLRLSNQLDKQAKCANSQDSVLGWSLSNGHWSAHLQKADAKSQDYKLPFKAWLDVICSHKGVMAQSSRAITILLDLKLEGKALLIKSATLGNQ